VPHWLAVALPPPLRRLITAPDVKCLALRRRDGHLAVSAAEGCILLTSLDALRGAAEAHPECCQCAPRLLLAPLEASGCAAGADVCRMLLMLRSACRLHSPLPERLVRYEQKQHLTRLPPPCACRILDVCAAQLQMGPRQFFDAVRWNPADDGCLATVSAFLHDVHLYDLPARRARSRPTCPAHAFAD